MGIDLKSYFKSYYGIVSNPLNLTFVPTATPTLTHTPFETLVLELRSEKTEPAAPRPRPGSRPATQRQARGGPQTLREKLCRRTEWTARLMVCVSSCCSERLRDVQILSFSLYSTLDRVVCYSALHLSFPFFVSFFLSFSSHLLAPNQHPPPKSNYLCNFLTSTQ